MTEDMQITALAPWKGSNRMLGPEVGKALKGCEWCGIPFAGGMAEVPHIQARTILVNDKHEHVINLAACAAHRAYGPKLYRFLRRFVFCQQALDQARRICVKAENENWAALGHAERDYDWAAAYFVSCWMGRSGTAGTDSEFKGNLSLRWNAGGGDSALRYHHAVLGIPAWRRTLRRCNFSTLDFREFLRNCLKHDLPKHGIYSDSPFPDAGDDYKHKFTGKDQRDLAELLGSFKQAKVVIRFYDHPLIRKLCARHPGTSKSSDLLDTQANKKAPEVLLFSRSQP